MHRQTTPAKPWEGRPHSHPKILWTFHCSSRYGPTWVGHCLRMVHILKIRISHFSDLRPKLFYDDELHWIKFFSILRFQNHDSWLSDPKIQAVWISTPPVPRIRIKDILFMPSGTAVDKKVTVPGGWGPHKGTQVNREEHPENLHAHMWSTCFHLFYLENDMSDLI